MWMTRYGNNVETPVRRLFDAFTSDPFFARIMESGEATTDNLAVDISETEGETVVRASLPGYRKENVHVEFQDGTLTIHAQHSESTEDKGETFLRRERRHEEMTRSIRLPKVDRNGEIDAELKDGVLTVRLPHSVESRPKQIAIK